MTILGHFPITHLQNSMVKILAVLYPNPYYNKVLFVWLVCGLMSQTTAMVEMAS